MTIVIFIGPGGRLDDGQTDRGIDMWMDKWAGCLVGAGFVFRSSSFLEKWKCRSRLRGRDDHEAGK